MDRNSPSSLLSSCLGVVGSNLEEIIDDLPEVTPTFPSDIKDDYLDCFGHPDTIGKIGTDIEDFKCSWLVVKALEVCNDELKKILFKNYGNPAPSKVVKIKALYNDINLQGVFTEFESKSYEKIASSIEAHPSKAVQAILKSFLGRFTRDRSRMIAGSNGF